MAFLYLASQSVIAVAVLEHKRVLGLLYIGQEARRVLMRGWPWRVLGLFYIGKEIPSGPWVVEEKEGRVFAGFFGCRGEYNQGLGV